MLPGHAALPCATDAARADRAAPAAGVVDESATVRRATLAVWTGAVERVAAPVVPRVEAVFAFAGPRSATTLGRIHSAPAGLGCLAAPAIQSAVASVCMGAALDLEPGTGERHAGFRATDEALSAAAADLSAWTVAAVQNPTAAIRRRPALRFDRVAGAWRTPALVRDSPTLTRGRPGTIVATVERSAAAVVRTSALQPQGATGARGAAALIEHARPATGLGCRAVSAVDGGVAPIRDLVALGPYVLAGGGRTRSRTATVCAVAATHLAAGTATATEQAATSVGSGPTFGVDGIAGERFADAPSLATGGRSRAGTAGQRAAATIVGRTADLVERCTGLGLAAAEPGCAVAHTDLVVLTDPAGQNAAAPVRQLAAIRIEIGARDPLTTLPTGDTAVVSAGELSSAAGRRQGRGQNANR